MHKNNPSILDAVCVHVVGIDGAGKTTYARALSDFIARHQYPCNLINVVEPSRSGYGAVVRSKAPNAIKLTASIADRTRTYDGIVSQLEALDDAHKKLTLVLHDRSLICCAAYQSENPAQCLEILQNQLSIFPTPDFVLWINENISTAHAREKGDTHTLSELAMRAVNYKSAIGFLRLLGVHCEEIHSCAILESPLRDQQLGGTLRAIHKKWNAKRGIHTNNPLDAP